MYRAIYFLAVVGALLTLTVAPAQDAQPKTKQTDGLGGQSPTDKSPSFWMKKKLDYSQELLAGITTEDFDLIADNARRMKALGKVEAFARNRSSAYTRQLQTFEEINDDIIHQADKDNLEGATLAFTQLTINCHKVLRQQRNSSGK